MDDGSMAEALVSQNLLARRQALLLSIDGEKREHGRQLLPAVRSLDGLQGYGGYEQADGALALLHPGGAGDVFGGLPHEFAPEVPGLRVEGPLGETRDLFRCEHRGATGLQRGEERLAHRGIDDKLVLRTANHPVIEALAPNHEACGLRSEERRVGK